MAWLENLLGPYPFDTFGDTDLVTPTNPNNGRPYGLSHIEFCTDGTTENPPANPAIVLEKTGATTNWAFEMGGVNALMRAGWTRTSLKAGDRVTVEGSRARDGSPLGSVVTVVLAATGQRLFTATGNN